MPTQAASCATIRIPDSCASTRTRCTTRDSRRYQFPRSRIHSSSLQPPPLRNRRPEIHVNKPTQHDNSHCSARAPAYTLTASLMPAQQPESEILFDEAGVTITRTHFITPTNRIAFRDVKDLALKG